MGARCGNNDQSDGDRVLLHPVFRNGSGLGKSTGRTWLILGGLGLPVTVKEIAEAGGGEPRTVRRHLSKLEQHGLAMKSGTQSAASGDDRRLDELAARISEPPNGIASRGVVDFGSGVFCTLRSTSHVER